LINTFTRYGAALIATFAVTIALLAGVRSENADAAAGAVTLASGSIPANLTQTVTVSDADLANGEFIIATIDPVSSGTAQFKANGGHSLVCINGSLTCDLDLASATVIKFDVVGTGGQGVVVLNVRLVDGLDGIDGDLGDGDEDIATAAWTQTASRTVFRTVQDVDGTAISAFTSNLHEVLVDVEVFDQNDAPVAGLEVEVSITVGDIISNDGGVHCDPTGALAPAAAGSDGACEFLSTGADTITVVADDVSGVGVLRVKVDGFSPVLQEILFYGKAANVSVSVEDDSSDRISNNGGETELKIAVTDARGIPVHGHTVKARLDPKVTAFGLEVPAGCTTVNGFCNIVVTEDSAAGASPEGVQTVQVSLNLPTFTVGASIDIDLVGQAANVAFVSQTPESISNLDLVTVVFRCTTSGGRNCLPGDVKAAATGSGIVIDTTPPISDDGTIAVRVIVEDLGGNVVKVVATVGGVMGSHNVVVGAGTAGGSFSPAIAPQGQTFTVYGGGDVTALLAALASASATSATASLGDGSTVTAIVTELSFVNADFVAAFPTLVPQGTILAVRSVN
jgi:hypothetical protein